VTYKIEVVRWEPEDQREQLGEYVFKEKPLIGDHIHIVLKIGSETVEVMRYWHSVFDADTHGQIPNIAENQTSVRLLVKRVEYHTEQPLTKDGYKYVSD
tara:strand:+ start:197 stop:493 length:297 start_codon:yes stop_codon:yes gene_type:complete